MITSVFRSSAHIPPGVAVVTNKDVVIYFGPIRELAEKMDTLAPGSIVHVSIQNYIQISKAAQAADPTAPSIDDLNKEFEKTHEHPTEGWAFAVYSFAKNRDKWVWRKLGEAISDKTKYPTAEAAYLAAIGE